MSVSEIAESMTFNERQVGRVKVPSFGLRPGAIVKIEFQPEHSREMHQVEDAARDEFRPHGQVAGVDLALNRSGLREFFHRQTFAEALVDRYRMTMADARERLRQVRIDPDAQLAVQGGNPRWMIGFIGAMSQRPDVLVFTTTGCDATGMERGLAAVREQLGNTAAIYLSCFNHLNIVEPDYAAVIQAEPVEQANAA